MRSQARWEEGQSPPEQVVLGTWLPSHSGFRMAFDRRLETEDNSQPLLDHRSQVALRTQTQWRFQIQLSVSSHAINDQRPCYRTMPGMVIKALQTSLQQLEHYHLSEWLPCTDSAGEHLALVHLLYSIWVLHVTLCITILIILSQVLLSQIPKYCYRNLCGRCML